MFLSSEALRKYAIADAQGRKFKTKTEAKMAFDHLSGLFARVKDGDGKLSRAREDFLHAFYTKHWYKGSNNAVRLVSWLAFPATWLYRGVKYLAGTSSMRHQVHKSMAKDVAIFMQVSGVMSRMTRALSRAVGGVFRMVQIAYWSVVTGGASKDVHKKVREMAPHRVTLTEGARTVYADAMNKSDVTSEHMTQSTYACLHALGVNKSVEAKPEAKPAG